MATHLLVSDVTSWLRLTIDETVILAPIVAATNSYVDSLPSIDREPPVGEEEVGAWTDGTKFGALLLACKLYGRRETPNGTVAFGEGGVSFVAKYDPEVSRLLHIGDWQKPVAR